MGSSKKSAPAKETNQTSVAASEPTKSTDDKTRRLKAARYQSFQLQKRIKVKTGKLPSSWQLLRRTFGTLKRNWKVFLGIVVINALLTMVLVQGFSAVNLSDAGRTTSLSDLLHGNFGQLASSASLFVYLLGSSGDSISAAAGVYQVFIGLVVSLAIIWSLRQIYAGNKIRIRDGFYKGMQPLVPFIMVLLVIGLQLVPLAAGAMLYTTVTNHSIAATAVEQLLWASLFFVLSVISLYMLCSSLFALYIVSLPDVTPMAALRAARQLVLHRRWEVLRKVIFLPIVLVLIAGAIIMPLILIATPIAAAVFFILSVMLLPVVHSYLYALYRSLL